MTSYNSELNSIKSAKYDLEAEIKEKQQQLELLKKQEQLVKQQVKQQNKSILYDNKELLLVFLDHNPACNDTYNESNAFRDGYKIPKCAKCGLYFLTKEQASSVSFSLKLTLSK